MIEAMDLRAGNYIHPPLEQEATKPDTGKYLRVLSIDLLSKKVSAKEDNNPEIFVYPSAAIHGCSINDIKKLVGGLSFNEHSIIIEGEGSVFIIHEDGSSIALPHIQYLHQFQNLFRSLTAQEFPFNIK
jgi:hypothetical protein